MDNETTIGLVAPMLQDILAEEPSYFLIDIRIKPTNNIKVYLDGDNGITIEKCVQFNRALYKKIEVALESPVESFVSTPFFQYTATLCCAG